MGITLPFSLYLYCYYYYYYYYYYYIIVIIINIIIIINYSTQYIFACKIQYLTIDLGLHKQHLYRLKNACNTRNILKRLPDCQDRTIVVPAIIRKICLSSGSAQFIAVRSVENRSHTQILYISHHLNEHNFALLLN